MARWHWPAVNATMFGTSGDVSKVFRNEDIKPPGFFAADPIPAEAALLAREAIQNAWDAARERRESRAPEDWLPFEICFRFRDVGGPESDVLIERLGLEELGARAAAVGDRRRLGLAERDWFAELTDGEDLRLLEVSEAGGGGAWAAHGTRPPPSSGWRCAAAATRPRSTVGAAGVGWYCVGVSVCWCAVSGVVRLSCCRC